jgi:hemerythrin-like domain-containing protein
MDVLEHLTQEHRQVEMMLEQLKSSEPGKERGRVVDQLVAALTKHMDMEERFLYPLVADTVGEESETEAEIEHNLAREGLTKLDALRDEPGFGAVVDMVEAGIAHHVHEEENEIFPQLRANAASKLAQLDPETLELRLSTLDLTKDDLMEKAREVGVQGRSSMTKEELADAIVAASR